MRATVKPYPSGFHSPSGACLGKKNSFVISPLAYPSDAKLPRVPTSGLW